MCYDNKYTLWYISIIEKSLKRNHTKKVNDGFENHHILPQSCGGDNSIYNLVALTPREHFIVHLCLIKMFKKEKYRGKMIYALMNMRASNGLQNRKNTSKIYEYFKLKWIELHSKRQSKYMSDPKNREKQSLMMFEKMSKKENRDRISKSLTGRKRPNVKSDIIKAKGDDRTERQKQAALKHSEFMKTRVPWNKGLTKETDSRVK